MDLKTVSRMSFKEAVALVDQQYNCFVKVTSVQHITVPYRYLNTPSTGIKLQLDSQLKLYSDELSGVPVAYGNIKSLQSVGSIIEDEPHMHLDIQLDFVVFRPTRGSILKATVNKIGRNHVGGLVHNCFNVSVPKDEVISSDGHKGSALYVGKEFLLRVNQLHSHNGMLSIKGFLQKEKQNENRATELSSVMADDTEDIPDVTTTPDKHKDRLDQAAEIRTEDQISSSKKRKRKRDSDPADSSVTNGPAKKRKTDKNITASHERGNASSMTTVHSTPMTDRVKLPVFSPEAIGNSSSIDSALDSSVNKSSNTSIKKKKKKKLKDKAKEKRHKIDSGNVSEENVVNIDSSALRSESIVNESLYENDASQSEIQEENGNRKKHKEKKKKKKSSKDSSKHDSKHDISRDTTFTDDADSSYSKKLKKKKKHKKKSDDM